MIENLVSILSRYVPRSFLEFSVFGNTPVRVLLAIFVFGIALIAFKVIQKVILRKIKMAADKTKTDVDDTLVEVIESVRPQFYAFLAFYFFFRVLVLPDLGIRILNGVLLFWIVYQAIHAVQIAIDFVVLKGMRSEEEAEAKAAANLVGKIAKIILWALGFLLILSNLGINVNSLIAGLGVGGIAVAFALQSILADLFSSLAIYFDKPFKVGDFIAVGQDKGTVERIGIKTTRLTSLGGEELVISNQELTSARLQNFKNMDERRVSFDFGVTYDTPSGKLRRIPKMIRDIINGVDGARVDRVHFMNFGDSALIFSVVYYVASKEYIDYANAQQKINFAIRSTFEKEKIEMAYPTQTIHLVQDK